MLVELTGTAAITLQIDGVIHKLKLPCNMLDIPPVESTRQKEPFCCLEVACTDVALHLNMKFEVHLFSIVCPFSIQ